MQRAAVRKLQHELGIVPQQVPLSDFNFLTRLHYCAADTDTYGADAEWGEHEVRTHYLQKKGRKHHYHSSLHAFPGKRQGASADKLQVKVAKILPPT